MHMDSAVLFGNKGDSRMNQTLINGWSRPYYGIQHLGAEGVRKSRVSVCDYGFFTVLHCWFPGCGFSPLESQHGTVEAARKAGELWLSQQQGA